MVWLERKNWFQPDLVLPAVPEVVLVQKPFSDPETEIRQPHLGGILVEGSSADVVHAKVSAVDPEPIEMEVAPAESKLKCIVKVRKGLVSGRATPASGDYHAE